MSKKRISITLLVILLISIFRTAPAQAQVQGGGWSPAFQLSSKYGKSSEAYMVADQYGYVHAFWTETLFDDESTIIKYARFDGTTWTKPNDIYVTDMGIRNVSPVVDTQGILHIAWSQGQYGIVYYSHAPATNALSVQNWSKPLQVSNVTARPVFLLVDSKGVLHILFTNQTDEPGVFYVRSEDGGLNWTEPTWLDPDIRPGYLPDSLSFQLDENDGLHASWFYGTREVGGTPDWVRYSHSLDGGHTWSAPFTIDRIIEGTNYSLDAASPVMITQGENVHIIWAGGSQPYRNHRYSTDSGLTWSAPVQIFGLLHGQAFDGLTVDGAGRVHFFGQIRYPMGIYHAYWDQEQWSTPSLVYLIAEEGSEEGIGNRIHAHNTVPVVRAGNQLVLAFGDGPADPHRRLFVTYRTLDDIPPTESQPTPFPTVTPQFGPTPDAALMTEVTPTATLVETADVERAASPGLPIQVALIPTLLVIGVTMFIQLVYKRKY